ncbi:hypothetical protein ACJQWK_01389 [Exserohilum turcicum]
MRGRQDWFSGNILLYDYLSRKRAPIFLDRNLTQILQAHEDLLSGRNTSSRTRSDFDFRSRWKPPSDDRLNKMIDRDNAKGSFVLEVHAIAPQDDQTVAQNEYERGPVTKIRNLMRISSTVRVSVIPPSSDMPATGSFAREAMLRGADRGLTRGAAVEMSPLLLHPRDISSDPGGITVDDSYRLLISMNFTSHADAQEMYNYLGLRDTDTATHLSTSYKNILECPEDRIILPLRAAGKLVGIGLEVSMYWNSTTGDSILASYNQHLKNTMEPPSSYPTPPRDATPRYKLTYVYGNEILERSEPVCLHCSRGKKLKDVHELEMHLNTWHEYFSYQLTPRGIDANGVEHYQFASEVTDPRADHRQRASGHTYEPCDVRVLAPDLPFDRRRYLEGDDGYQRAARIEKHLKYQKRKQVSEHSTAVTQQRKPPEEIQEVPRKQRKTFVVPEPAQGVTFFRSWSKRPLEPGEEISESDDEIDEGWMRIRRYAEIDKANLSADARRFLKAFDTFIHDEHLHADIHAGDAIIRFARAHGSRIWQENIMDEFTKKMDELLEDKVILQEIYTRAMEIVNSQKTLSGAGSNELSRRLAELDVQHRLTGGGTNKAAMPWHDPKGKGKAIVTDTGNLTPYTAASDGDALSGALEGGDVDPPYDECYCGVDASLGPGASDMIACSDIVSIWAQKTCNRS